MQNIRFSCTSLVGTNKKGILKPDENGYYSQPIGGLNVFNSAGMYYTYEGAKHLFEDQSSAFMRRVKRGALRGENGHPKKLSNQSLEEYANRILTIDEANICVHWAEISLDFDNFKDANGKPIIGIIGKFIPSGEKGYILEKALANPLENICFSIRSFTEDYYVRGVIHRDLRTVVTFDFVNEPGIGIAEKYKSPTLESFDDSVFTRSQLERVVDRQVLHLGTESATLTKDELFSSFNWKPSIQNDQHTPLRRNQADKPGYLNW